MFKLGDYIDRTPIYLPPTYTEFDELPPSYNPYVPHNQHCDVNDEKSEDDGGDDPTNWVLMISGK